MSSEIAAANVLAEGRGRAGQNFGFGAADIGQQSLRRKRRPQTSDQFDDRAHRRRQQHHLAASHRDRRIRVRLINRALVPRLFQHRGAVAADDPPGKRRFFSASPKEPPMRPVPMMVIWRIAI